MAPNRIRLLALAALLLPGLAHGQPRPGLHLLGSDGATRARLESTDVSIAVSGLLARTTLVQTFENPTADWVEGRYVFPLPQGATVDELRVRIGERVIEGVVREKKTARETFERARESGRSAGLVERHRGNLFSTSMTNIAPGERIEVRIGFGQTVRYRHGRFHLRFPTTTLPRYRNGAGDADPEAAAGTIPPVPREPGARSPLRLTVDLHAGLALAGVESLHHPVVVSGSGSERRIELAEPEHAAGRDFELAWRPAGSDRLRGAMFVESMHGRAHALLMLVPPDEFRSASLRRELILVLDRSGSMQGDAFEQAREAVRLALDRLGADDRFNVVAFNGRATPLFDAPMAATNGHLRRAYRFIDSLAANGGTEIDAALRHAMSGLPDPGYLRQIVFATDGAVANEDRVLELIDRELDDARLFAVGIGHGVNDAFLSAAATMGRGTMTRVADCRDIAGRMNELLAQLESPVLEDMQIDWPVGAETWPEKLPDLYAGEPLMVTARLDAAVSTLDDGAVRVTGFRDLRFVEMEWPVSRFRSAPGVARAWGRSRFTGLQRRRPGEMDEQLRRDEMLLTALDYRIVTSMTSLVAVDRTPRRSSAAALRRQEIAGTPPADRARTMLRAMPATGAGSLEAGLKGLSILAIVLLVLFNRRIHRDRGDER
ncbi:MAG: marine proteobacterial sortase target protein [Candidatus Wenzhouxiangella sp. M2_3B_020]